MIILTFGCVWLDGESSQNRPEFKKVMDNSMKDTVKRLLIRLEDARIEVRGLSNKSEYPATSKLERVYDAIETAEKYLKDFLD